MIRAGLFALALILPQVAAAEGDDVQLFTDTDAKMNAAIADAQSGLTSFLDNALDADGNGLPGTGLKVGLPKVTGDGGLEHIWVGPLRYFGNGTFAGILGNEPNWLGDLRAGDQVDFDISQISDWSFFGPDGKLYGNYTTRVMLPQMDKSTAADLQSILSANPVPADWQR